MQVFAAQVADVCCCCLVCGAGLASDLFSNRRSVRSCLACLVPQCTAALQESRDSTRLSHYWTLIDAIFRSILQVSWNCSLGSFTSLEDATILHSSNMAQLTEMALTRERQEGGRSGALSTSMLGILSCHRMLNVQMETVQSHLVSSV